ncbi:MAG: hypothetical protein NWT07_13020 [Saprospiraceae bacterium]|nr:hypothetical protein [Saprospiraceae bacterium]
MQISLRLNEKLLSSWPKLTFWQLPEEFLQGDAKKSTGINLQYLKGLKTNYLIP